jgi:hypothetical protein
MKSGQGLEFISDFDNILFSTTQNVDEAVGICGGRKSLSVRQRTPLIGQGCLIGAANANTLPPSAAVAFAPAKPIGEPETDDS